MSTTTNPDSILCQLRRLVPRRPLTPSEAHWLAELQAAKLLGLAGIDQPGTPTEVVTDLPFLQVIVRPDAPVPGGSIWLKPRWLIVLGDVDTPTRMRFSLFHELKHILDHGLTEHLYPGSQPYRQDPRAEQAANHFAACALMSRRIVKRLWGQRYQNVPELAAQFEVSEQAMKIRLLELGLTEPAPRCGFIQPLSYVKDEDADRILPIAA